MKQKNQLSLLMIAVVNCETKRFFHIDNNNKKLNMILKKESKPKDIKNTYQKYYLTKKKTHTQNTHIISSKMHQRTSIII